MTDECVRCTADWQNGACGDCDKSPSDASDGYDRDAIVTGMCMTWGHDYGLLKTSEERELVGDAIFKIMCGMTQQERDSLYSRMNQVFEHNIKPLLDRA